MRNTILATVAVLAIGGVTTGILVADAQPAPPPPGPQAGGPMQRPQWGGWMRRMRDRREGRGPVAPGTFALIYRQEDRQLTPPDVQKIAEAFLLWQGNHTWKVANVKQASDGAIGFDLTTASGDVVASFTMDPHSGRMTRTG